MTTEDDFQRALDANPEDWMTRLVFADWLDDRGDPRADGYRALGVLRAWSMNCKPTASLYIIGTYSNHNYGSTAFHWRHSLIPHDWFGKVVGNIYRGNASWRYFRSRREAEDETALVFAQLPAARRNEILALAPALGA